MSDKKQYKYKRIIANVFWSLLGMGTVVLLGAAIDKKENKNCKGVEISITGVQSNFFIDKEQVKSILERMNGGKLTGKQLNAFSLSEMENSLLKNLWIKSKPISAIHINEYKRF